MRFRDRPLLVDGLDADLYLERPELERRIVDPLAAGRNVLLLGEAGSGKSTLLRRIAGLLSARHRPVVVVNAGLADDAADLLGLVARALTERRLTEGRGALSAGPGALAGGRDTGSAAGAAEPRSGAEGLLRAVRRLPPDPASAILVDGLIDATAAYDVFGRLRDELWALGHSWAVAVRPRDSASLRTPPVDAFWGAVVEIPPLEPAEVDRLLRLGLADEELRTVTAAPPAGVHPRYVIRAAQEILSRDGGPEPRQSALDPRAAPLGRSEAMAVAELHGIGRPVSAQDPELLERLGWSRPYAQRILSQLEADGVLRSVPERSDRPGRPRKLYELNPFPPPA